MFLGAVIIEDHLGVLDDKQWRVEYGPPPQGSPAYLESFDPDLNPFDVPLRVNVKQPL